MKKGEEIGVKMVNQDSPTATRTYDQIILKFDNLGKEIKISPKACVTVNKAGFKTEFFVDTVSINIGIGNDHTADLIMTRKAWEALKDGEEVNITTVKEFRENFL